MHNQLFFFEIQFLKVKNNGPLFFTINLIPTEMTVSQFEYSV